MNMSLRLKIVKIFVVLFACSALSAEDTSNLVAGAELFKLRKNVDPNNMGVVDSYQEAVELEKEITQMYREIRAAKLSRIQRQSLKKSLNQTLVPISKRLEPKKEVLKIKAKNSDDLKHYQDELKKVMQENDAIVANAEEMLQSLLPEQQQEQAEESQNQLEQLLEELTPQKDNSVQEKMEQVKKQSNEQIKQQMEQLEQQTQEQMNKAKDSLEEALEEMKQAEVKVAEKLEEIKKEEEKKKEEKQEDQPEAKKEEQKQEEKKEEPKKEETKVELAEKLKENLVEAKVAVQEAIKSIEEKKDNIEEKVEQAREALKKIAEALKETVEVDKQLAEKKQQEPQKHTEKAVKKLEKAKEDMTLAAEAILMASKLNDILNGKLSSDQQIAQQQALGILARAEAGKYLDLTKQMKGQDLKIQPDPVTPDKRPPDIKKYFKNEAGRKLVKNGGVPAVWFYVDDWYILGPYDNKGRMNIQRVYPPESIIDLDAYYIGKHNAKLRWLYDSFADTMLRPTKDAGDYTIFYGFTELYFEEASDLWIAVGSDDRSDLWINGMPVWHSSNQLKSWRIDEGYRKVHFKKGINKILFRLENGWHSMGFSLLINTYKPQG